MSCPEQGPSELWENSSSAPMSAQAQAGQQPLPCSTQPLTNQESLAECLHKNTRQQNFSY